MIGGKGDNRPGSARPPASVASTAADDDIPPMPAYLASGLRRPPIPSSTGPTTRPDAVRRGADIPMVNKPAFVGQTAAPEPKTLVVGRDIHLNGAIAGCEKLLVEGRVDATLSGSRFLEITESGRFKGEAQIEEAEVRGLFDGRMTVRGRLVVRASGRISGEIRYGQIEIECGGEIGGTVEPLAQSASAGPKDPSPEG